MIPYLETFLQSMRPAFSRFAAFAWFVIAFAGFVARHDAYGVSSLVRVFCLTPGSYLCLLHFFHSSAWSVESLRRCWWQWLAGQEAAHVVGGRIVLLGDHTKTPKDGRRIPAVETLHQDSETASKPSFFRGHHWGCLGLLVKARTKYFATPVWAEIHQDSFEETRATRIVTAAATIAEALGRPACLVLDAFFSVGPVFLTAAKAAGDLCVVTRAKKSVVAYVPAPPSNAPRRGRKRKYGKKLKLMQLFDAPSAQFQTAPARVYGQSETVRCLALDLLWKPTKGMLRFVLCETSRGRIILMTSDLTLAPLTALELYAHRVTIETLFNSLKNLLGAMGYHFWSKYLQPASRRPTRNSLPAPTSSKPHTTHNTLAAIEKSLHIHMIVLGVLQLLAWRCASQIHAAARCWLRTPCGPIPSEFVARTALANTIQANLGGLAKDTMTRLIRRQQIPARKMLDIANSQHTLNS